MGARKQVHIRLWHWLIDKSVAPGEGSPELKNWRSRYSVVGRFQARYLFLILVLSIFFVTLDRQVSDNPACLQPNALQRPELKACEITVPVIDLQLGLVHVWVWAAPVLFLILLAILGSLRAALKAKIKSGLTEIEAFDEHPNLIDMAVYSYPEARGLKAILRVLSYPLYLSGFWVASLILAWNLWESEPRPDLSGVSLTLTFFLASWSGLRLIKIWVKRMYEMIRSG